jgi:signal transduction histidine kinase
MDEVADKPQQERADTDESLQNERAKTDDELQRRRAHIEEDADEVVAEARLRATEVLRAARERTDRDLAAQAGDSSIARREIRTERAHEDRALAQERAIADDRLYAEREERQRALSGLLSLEREATDERLQIERARADRTIATRDDFLGMVSHDLRTLLGGIALSAAILAQHASAQPSPETVTLSHVKRIQSFAARMNRLVGDLLDVVSLETGNLAIVPRPHDAVKLVRELMETFQPAFAAKRLALSAEIVTGSLLAKFDEERIMQVLANLLSNALKFTEQGQVALSVAPLGPEICFSVTDTGLGIPQQDLEAVFDRFRQVKPHDRRGLGLGLYIAKCIVEAHGGRIWAEANEGGGTAVRFTLPAAPGHGA